MTDILDDAARRRRAHQVVNTLHDRLLAGDMAGFADQWAPDGVMEFPFAPPGWPAPANRDEVREYLRPFPERVDFQGVRHQTRHETADPDTLIIEWGVDGVAHATGKPYQMDYVAVITVGNEGITRYKDYWNAMAAGYAMGSLTDMVRAYAGEEGAA